MNFIWTAGQQNTPDGGAIASTLFAQLESLEKMSDLSSQEQLLNVLDEIKIALQPP
jgi:hypothetical protein